MAKMIKETRGVIGPNEEEIQYFNNILSGQESRKSGFFKKVGLGAAAIFGLGSNLGVIFEANAPSLEIITATSPATSISLEAEENQETTFGKIISLFVNEAQKRRTERATKDPEYSKRVDQELNENRVNFLLFSWGETYEPPVPTVDIIGSQSILSYNLKTKTFDVISITHDTRAPEIERFLKSAGKYAPPTKIHHAYGTGGFRLMGETLENATGLSIDFQFAFPDKTIVTMVDKVFGKVKVDIPKAFVVNSVVFQDKFYPPVEYPAGLVELDGLQAIQFIKAVAIEENPHRPDPEQEHNVRKVRVFKGMLKHWQNLENPLVKALFLGKLLTFLDGATKSKSLEYDFDPTSLLMGNIGKIIIHLKSLLLDNNQQASELKIEKTIYICDKKHGSGGVRWISPEEAKKGGYVDKNMEIPIGGDPDAEDLVTNYWPSTRRVVKTTLMPPITPE